jgi:hypothetical protein
MLMYAHPPLSNLASDPEGRAVVWQAILRKDPHLLAKSFRLLSTLLTLLHHLNGLIVFGTHQSNGGPVVCALYRRIG